MTILILVIVALAYVAIYALCAAAGQSSRWEEAVLTRSREAARNHVGQVRKAARKAI